MGMDSFVCCIDMADIGIGIGIGIWNMGMEMRMDRGHGWMGAPLLLPSKSRFLFYKVRFYYLPVLNRNGILFFITIGT